MENGYIIQHDELVYEIHTEIMINATPQQVWQVLTDFKNMPNWSSSFQGIEGEFKNNSKVYSLYQDKELGLVKAPHTIYVIDGIQFWWSDPFNVLPNMSDNHHYIVNRYGDNQTRFIQRDTHTGQDELTLPNGDKMAMNAKILSHSQLEPFREFNRELKAECERLFG